MFLLQRPSLHQIANYVEQQKTALFSYPETGASRSGDLPPRYQRDRYRTQLGTGRAIYARAVSAVRGWEMFHIGWVELQTPDAPIQMGTTVGVLMHHLGFWSLNGARIVYVVEEEAAERAAFGFAYGTLSDHAEKGEERFLVQWDKQTGEVSYEIAAYSQPRHPLTFLGYPVVRHLQRRFGAHSLEAMRRAVAP